MILYFDTETTGFYPGQICQLSYVMESRESVARKNFYFTVNHVEEGARAVTGLSAELLLNLSKGRRFCDSAEEIHGDFCAADLVVAHNFRFDYAFMQEEFGRLNRLFEYRQELCTMKFFTPRLKLPRANGGYKYPKLTELCEKLGVTPAVILSELSEGREHDARYDAEAVFRCVRAARATDSHLAEMIEERLG